MSVYEYSLKTAPQGLTNITASVREALAGSGVSDGICVIYSPHTTGGITINENADPDVVTDFLLGMGAAYPDRREFRHMEGNSAAHLKTSAVGPSQTVIVQNGRLLLGQWQGIYFCEFDGPRNRRYYVKILADR